MKDIEIKEIYINEFDNNFSFFSAPGRINIIGEHTDYNNGFVLPAAIDKKIYLAISPTDDSVVTIKSADFNETVSFNLLADLNNLPHWALYPYGVIQELKILGHFLGGFNAVFGGDIPTGAGLSSSAALESVFAVALNSLFNLNLDKMTLAKVGQKAEHNYAKVKCGIMDQFASMHGKAGHVIKLDCRSLDFEYFPLELGNYELILADTQVKHNLAASEYNLRRYLCEEGLKIMHSQNPTINSLRDIEPKDLIPFKEKMNYRTYLCCEYVAEENKRVMETCNALSKGQIEIVGELMYQSHYGLQKKYKVSCDELDLLVDTASTIEGVIGSRMMGGGFGGCTINLVKSAQVDLFKARTTTAFLQKFGKNPIFYQVNIGNGAAEIQ